jgi:hypothetical protein
VIEDILYDHRDLDALTDALLVQDKFRILRHDGTGEKENCNRQSAFNQRLTTSLAANKTFCVAIHLHDAVMESLRLDPRKKLTIPSRLFPQATAPAGPTPAASLPLPLPAQNKLDVNETLDLNFFSVKDIQSLNKISDIQRWYNGLHSKGRVCGIYTSPWQGFVKGNYMVEGWSPSTIRQIVYDRCDLMSAAIHSLLSSTGIFKGECEEFGHMVSNREGNGYLALYHIVRLFHPVLGQTSAQPPQPQQKKAQPFAEHIANYLEYFQLELCSGRTYSTNERVILVLSRLHPTWRDALKQKYHARSSKWCDPTHPYGIPACHADCYAHAVVCGRMTGVTLHQHHWPKFFRVCHSRIRSHNQRHRPHYYGLDFEFLSSPHSI